MKRLPFLLNLFLIPSMLCPPAQGQERGIRHFLKGHRGTLLRLTVLTASAEFDAYSTRRYITAWGNLPTGPNWGPHPMREQNPLQRPFANSPALYVTVPTQDVAIWALASLVLRHHHRTYKLAVADAGVGYSSVDHVVAGFHNLRLASAADSLLARTCGASPSSSGCSP